MQRNQIVPRWIIHNDHLLIPFGTSKSTRRQVLARYGHDQFYTLRTQLQRTMQKPSEPRHGHISHSQPGQHSDQGADSRRWDTGHSSESNSFSTITHVHSLPIIHERQYRLNAPLTSKNPILLFSSYFQCARTTKYRIGRVTMQLILNIGRSRPVRTGAYTTGCEKHRQQGVVLEWFLSQNARSVQMIFINLDQSQMQWNRTMSRWELKTRQTS